MPAYPNSPKLIKGGIVLVDAQTLAPIQDSPVRGGIIALQYNPESITRTLQASTIGSDGQDRSEAMRFKGPPVETIKLEAEIDAADQLAKNDPIAVKFGVQPQLAALESLISPTSQQIEASRRLAATGTLEILPMQSALTLFVWSKQKIVPVRITELSVTEEAFDPNLNPILASVSLGMRVLNMNDLGFGHRGSDLFSRYHRDREQLASKNAQFKFGNLGIEGIT